jgi:hypothetical protein
LPDVDAVSAQRWHRFLFLTLCVLKTLSACEAWRLRRSWIASNRWSDRAARWLAALRTCFRLRGELLLEFAILRHQLAVLQRIGTRRPCFPPADRLLWILLSRLWADFADGGLARTPHTIIRSPRSIARVRRARERARLPARPDLSARCMRPVFQREFQARGGASRSQEPLQGQN